ncbi:MAG: glycosyltransferase family 4 protein [Bacteroidia bacterium]|nr:glycosyltransferase family 4 protein [Bacteroidia bacterium]MCZ2249908.1 glycosyltransferase family 4 protein [Bacteroidia bacterium]
MNILHVIPSLSKGGAERLTIDICNALTDKGHNVMLLSMSPINAYSFIDFNFKYKVISSKVVPSLSGKTQANTHEYEDVIRKFKPHIIHSHLFVAEMLTRYKPHPGIKYFTHLHDNMPQFNGIKIQKMNKSVITNFYEKQLLIRRYKQCNNYFVAISQDAYDFFFNQLGDTLAKRIFLLNNAIDYNRFYRGKRKFDYTENTTLRMVSVGSLVKKKNQQFLVDIALELKKLNLNFHIDILGDGPEYDSIKNKITNSQVQQYLTLHGNVNNVEDFLHQSLIYVHPASYEPFGLVLLEAMAAGLPCVCLDGRGNRDIIKNDFNGYIFKEQDAAQFAKTILNLFNQREKLQTMSNNAIDFAADFDMANYTERLLNLYNKVTA